MKTCPKCIQEKNEVEFAFRSKAANLRDSWCRKCKGQQLRTKNSRLKAKEATVNLPNEDWRPIPGYEGLYAASNLGRIRSEERQKVRANGRPMITRARFLAQHPESKGYLQVRLYSSTGEKDTYRVHRLVYQAFNGPIDSIIQVDHKDSNILNNNKDNLAAIDGMDHAIISNERYAKRLFNEGFDAGYAQALKDHKIS